MVSLKKKSESLIKYYIKVTCALKWARKLPRKTETYESAKCVPCNTRKCTHNGFVSDLLKWALKCRFYATGPWVLYKCLLLCKQFWGEGWDLQVCCKSDYKMSCNLIPSPYSNSFMCIRTCTCKSNLAALMSLVLRENQDLTFTMKGFPKNIGNFEQSSS